MVKALAQLVRDVGLSLIWFQFFSVSDVKGNFLKIISYRINKILYVFTNIISFISNDVVSVYIIYMDEY